MFKISSGIHSETLLCDDHWTPEPGKMKINRKASLSADIYGKVLLKPNGT